MLTPNCETLPAQGDEEMDPFELFEASGIYKFAILYFSRSRGLAIVGKNTTDERVEVIQISGEVDPHTGNFTALDYATLPAREKLPVISKRDFENLVTFIESKIDDQTRMSIIEPERIRTVIAQGCVQDRGKYLH
jgi:hypothetical protein